MTNSIRDLELLDLVTQDDLDKSTSTEVDKRRSDPAFVLEYKKALALREVIMASTHKSLKAELQLVDAQLVAKSQMRKNIIVAISALLLLAMAALAYNAYNDHDSALSNDLYAMYYAPHPNVVDPLTKGSQDLSLSGTQQYELGNYDEAIKILSNSDLDDASIWYLSQANMAKGNWIDAAIGFDQIIKSKAKYSQEAKWFRALIYLHQSEAQEAKKLLKEVASTYRNGYTTKAKDLLSKM